MAPDASWDVAIVGGGLCGSFTAYTAARLGARTVVLEEHPDVGFPLHCSGHVGINGLRRAGFEPPQNVVENEIRGAVFYSPACRRIVLEREKPVTLVLDRAALDAHLAGMAQRAGAEYLLGARARRLGLSGGRVTGVSFSRGLGRGELEARIVVDAEGAGSALLKGLLRTTPSRFVAGSAQVYVDGVVDVDRDFVEVYLGRGYAPGFFAWIIPARGDSAKVGLATFSGSPTQLLRRFMEGHPIAMGKLRRSRVRAVSTHAMPLGGPIRKTYRAGLLVVGDAAGQVKPTTGGGVVMGLICARMAGRTAHESLRASDQSERFLSRYQRGWRRAVGFDLEFMRRVRLALSRMSDRALERLFETFTRTGLAEAVSRVNDIDLQARALLSALHPGWAPAFLELLRAFAGRGDERG